MLRAAFSSLGREYYVCAASVGLAMDGVGQGRRTGRREQDQCESALSAVRRARARRRRLTAQESGDWL